MRSSLKLVYWLHGHECPMSTLGFRAGTVASRLLKVKRGDEHIVKAVVHFRSCAVDGIQIGFPATHGNSNLNVFDNDDRRFEFINMKTKKKVEIIFATPLLHKLDEYMNSRSKLSEIDRKKLFNLLIKYTQSAPVKNLFICSVDKT